MPPKRQTADPAPSLSPVLFMTVDAGPMNFFLRPGPVKRKLQPLITAGGGVMCSVQKSGAILLIDPEEKSSVPQSAAHWYVSTQYIYDCVEKEEQLNLEDYRFNPEVVLRHSPRLNSSKQVADGLSGGRLVYTPEDDAAILDFVNKQKKKTGGNRLWQEMEKRRVTSHSWQSMKSRYRSHLEKKQSGSVEVEMSEDADEAAKEAENQECDVEKSSCEADDARSAESSLTQIDLQPVPVGCTPENKNVQTADLIGVEEEQNQESDENSHSEPAEVKTSQSSQTEGANPQTSAQLRAAGTTEPGRDAPETSVSPHKQSLPEDSPPVRPKSSSKKTSKSPKLEQPKRRVTRRQLELEMSSSSPEPYGKKLRSSSGTEQPISSPQVSKKTKPAVKSAHQDSNADQPPPKRARGKRVAAEAESQLEQSGHDTDSKTSQADESNPVPQKAEKKKGKRQLGILEVASKEFENESESDEDEASDLRNRSETAAALTESQPKPSDTSAEPTSEQSKPETEPGPRENLPEPQASSDRDSPDAAAAAPAGSEPGGAASKAHLFIFDSESQEEESQSVLAVGPAAPSNPQPTAGKGAAFSLTQAQLEEDKQRIRDLMNQTNLDFVSVTKALLKTSGYFSAALDLLLNPSSVSAPIWNRHDDSLLLSSDPAVRQKLQEKYGEENVAKRMVFLEVQG
ncbi:telomeric repeat-binding factor 2-interacting protein 1 [Kryptolebias marmoratus]|uniref:Telomeric repeat-binding factor 2-interacting protein 1 n=1 Tax=Kryptolebias marmoratus TaxID=37003 RepID=A0A3Q3AAS7_KRYMA|nr:telomeric repeat-binding factor 2-interacting protein 1 [Kryptolebias marmoratus]